MIINNENDLEVKLIVVNLFMFLSKTLLFLVAIFHVFVLKASFSSELSFQSKVEDLFFSFGTIISLLMILTPLLMIYLFSRIKKRLKAIED